jgi:hypothetical protein
MGRKWIVEEQDDGETLYFFIVLILCLPIAAPALYAVDKSWVFLASMHWHSLFKILVALSEVIIIYLVVQFLYKTLPRIVSKILTATYLSIVYGYAASMLGADHIWTGGFVVLSGVIGYYLGGEMADKVRYS